MIPIDELLNEVVLRVIELPVLMTRKKVQNLSTKTFLRETWF